MTRVIPGCALWMAEADETFNYYAGDALGSVNYVLNNSAAIVNKQFTNAWGESLVDSHTVSDRHGFTQRERDAESGVMHYRARFYDPRLGRFGGKDPLVTGRVQKHYLYVSNNPLIRIDALGKQDQPPQLAELWSSDAVRKMLEESRPGTGTTLGYSINTAETNRIIKEAGKTAGHILITAGTWGFLRNVAEKRAAAYIMSIIGHSIVEGVAEWSVEKGLQEAMVRTLSLGFYLGVSKPLATKLLGEKIGQSAGLFATQEFALDIAKPLAKYVLAKGEDDESKRILGEKGLGAEKIGELLAELAAPTQLYGLEYPAGVRMLVFRDTHFESDSEYAYRAVFLWKEDFTELDKARGKKSYPNLDLHYAETGVNVYASFWFTIPKKLKTEGRVFKSPVYEVKRKGSLQYSTDIDALIRNLPDIPK